MTFIIVDGRVRYPFHLARYSSVLTTLLRISTRIILSRHTFILYFVAISLSVVQIITKDRTFSLQSDHVEGGFICKKPTTKKDVLKKSHKIPRTLVK